MLEGLAENNHKNRRKYLTVKEVSKITGIGTYTLRQLTYARAMPHRKVKARIIFDENEIQNTISKYKEVGWDDPEKEWDIKIVQGEIDALRNRREESMMIEDILRKIIKEELSDFSGEILNRTKKDKESYYGRTVLTIKEAAAHFRTSPSTIYSLIKEDGMPHLKIQSRFYIVLEDAEAYLWRETAKSYATEGNIYWQRILQRLDWEERERNAAYKTALSRLENRY
ncbi:helix-turn-helix domain-containing protein [Paenibacillus sp. EPM92]|uniref:helix-turn-helix domain-containing protein n=1 Tax=Paenibacillus sp. EPM92 TaxID=1561195 RepID=UPI001915D244|nr:helix-turn-helix domain-containing protein [Paenibacillus sp. EPM92]